MVRFVRFISGSTLGSLPGILVALNGNERSGIAVSAIGALAGGLLSVPGVSPARIVKLFVATMIAYNVPFVGGINDILNEDNPDSTASNERENNRAQSEQPPASIDRESRYADCVIRVAFLTGLVSSGFAASIDAILVISGADGVILPLGHSNDSLLAQGIMLTLAGAVWTAAIAVSIVSRSYRNIVIGIAVFTGFLSGMIGFAAYDGRGPNGLAVAFAFTTIAVGVFIGLAWFSNESSGDQADY